MATRNATPIVTEPRQVPQNSQKTIWDAVDDLRTKGTSSFVSREGVRVFSLSQPDPTVTAPSRNPQASERVPQAQQMTTLSHWTPVVTWSPPTYLDPDQFRVDAAFDGTILEVGGDSFIARLVNKLDENDVQEDAEFAFDEVSKADRSLIRLGAMFYWFIGRTEKPHGQQSNTSLLRFRRLPAWTESDVIAARTRAGILRAVLPLDSVHEET